MKNDEILSQLTDIKNDNIYKILNVTKTLVKSTFSYNRYMYNKNTLSEIPTGLLSEYNTARLPYLKTFLEPEIYMTAFNEPFSDRLNYFNSITEETSK